MTQEELTKFCKELTDKGKIVEAGFIGLRHMSIPPNAPQFQVDEMRNAFFAGAQHIFYSIMSMLDPGTEATEADLKRIDLIKDELDSFINSFIANKIKPAGRS